MPADPAVLRSATAIPPDAPPDAPPASPGWEVATGAEPEACAICNGTGMEVVPEKGARRCACRQRDRSGRLLEAARIPRRYERCTFQSYRPGKGSASHLHAFNLAHRLAADYPAVDRGLLLTGPCGVGKTHLSVAILRGLMEKGVPCLFYELGALLKEIQGSYDPGSGTSEMNLLARVNEAEVLVLDELGAAKPTEWALDTTHQIINDRYGEKRLTIITTNYGDGRNSSSEETLEDRIGVRLRSRLYEMCRTVEIEGEDYRRRYDAR